MVIAESNGQVTDDVTWPWKVKAVTPICLGPRISKMARDRVGTAGGWKLNPQFMSTDTHFWVKIGFKFQSLGKLSNISTSDPPVPSGQFQCWLEIQTWLQLSTNRKWGMASRIMTCQMTSRDHERSRSWPQYIWCPITRKQLEIKTWFQRPWIENDLW